jgi:Cof subfamily protein (haloacid dehalogenase superfamily)
MGTNGKFKLLLLDVDGTLLGEEGTISAEDRETLARVRECGIRVSLSTGRIVQSCRHIIKELSLDGYHIFCDGALVSNPESDEEVYAKLISMELVRQAVQFAHRHEINLDLYSASRYFVERETWATTIRRKFFALEPIVTDFNRLSARERIIKGTLVVRSAEEKAKAEAFRFHFRDSLDFSVTKSPAYPEVDFINVLSRGVGKGVALQTLAAHLGITATEVIAIGDGSNDISLLSNAGLAIAMGNAPSELRAVADYVTVDVEHSGISLAVKKLVL